MRSVLALPDADLTAKARIRERALALFAAGGVAGTSARAVAQAAGVSPALVIHHFGSKDGLVQAVDEEVVRRITLALKGVSLDSAGDDLLARRTDVIGALLRSQPDLCAYIAAALAERTGAGADLFERMFAAARDDGALVRAGALRGDADPFWRALNQLILVVGPLLLRPLIERQLGGSLLEERNLDQWMGATRDLLTHGLYRERGADAAG